MADQKLPGIIGFIEKGQINFFVQNTKGIISFPFPPGMVSDLEVRKMEDLAMEFKNFLDQSKFPHGHVYLILANELVFEKDFPLSIDESVRLEMEKFIKAVPFENVGNREYRVGKIQKVVASNRELYETLQSVLESQGFTVLVVTPASVLPDVTNAGFNVETAKKLLGKTVLLRQNSFIHQEEALEEEMQRGTDPRKNKKLLMLLLVFGALLTTLGIMAGKMLFETKQPKVVARAPAEEAEMAPTPPPPAAIVTTQEKPATTSAVNNAIFKVQVINSSGVDGLAAAAKKQLASLGLRDIETGNGTTVNATKNLIGFQPKISAELRQKTVETLKKDFGDFAISESADQKPDILITLTRISGASNSATQITP